MRKEGARDVPAPLVLRQPPLTRRTSRSRQQRSQRKLPFTGELARQPLGRMVSTLEPAIRIARDEDDTRGNRSRHRLADDRRSPAGKPAQATLLPGAHDRTKPVVVRQHRPSTREGEPATGAFATTIHRPRRRSTAPRAQAAARCGGASPCSRRKPELRETSRRDSVAAGVDRARHHATGACVTCLCQLGEYSARSGRPFRCRIRLSASSSWAASPMSNHWPSKRYAYTGSRLCSHAT